MKSGGDQVVGIDLGHGETASAIVPLNGQEGVRPLVVNGKTSQVSAFGFSPKGDIVLGTTAAHNRMVVDLRLGFKVYPPGTGRSREDLTTFLREYIRKLIVTDQLRIEAGFHYFVGHPSGWDGCAAGEYRELIATVLDPVYIVPESRAVLAFASSAGLIEEEAKRSAILVIDLGSSTTDVSFISSGVVARTFDGGEVLGSDLIDCEILRRAVESSLDRKEIEGCLSDGGGSLRRVLLMLCREAKELYWSNEDGCGGAEVQLHLPVCPEKGLYIDWSLNRHEMDLILRTPIERLGGGWLESLSGLLERIRSVSAHNGEIPELVLLSGGPSYMTIVREICQGHFPEAQLKWCTPPNEVIARGLASWGRIFLSTTEFSRTIDEFCSGKLGEIVSADVDRMISEIADRMTVLLIEEVVRPAILSWRQGDIKTLEGLESKVGEFAATWIESIPAQEAVREACNRSLQRISKEVNLSTLDVCASFGIPHAALFLDLAIPIERGSWAIGSVDPFDAALGVARAVTVVTMVVLSAIAKGFLVTATLATGPPGWLVLGLLVTWAAVFGLMSAEEKLRSVNLPISVRKAFLGDEKVSKLLKEASPRLRGQIVETIGKNERRQIRDEISVQVSTSLHSRADEARWIIS